MKLTLLLCAAAACSVQALHKKHQQHTAAVPQNCDSFIPGDWTGFEPQPLNDLYSLTWSTPAAPGAWTVKMVSGGGWNVGQGQFSADNQTTTISFDSGVKLTGNVTSAAGTAPGSCSMIVWDNGSNWQRRPPPPAPITGEELRERSAACMCTERGFAFLLSLPVSTAPLQHAHFFVSSPPHTYIPMQTSTLLL